MSSVDQKIPQTSGESLQLSRRTERKYEARVARAGKSRDEVKAELDAKSADITARLATIQETVVGSSERARKLLSSSPLLPVAGSLAAGLAVGLIFGGSGRSRKNRRVRIPEDVSELLVRRIDQAREAGVDPVDVVNASLSRLVPSVPTEGTSRSSGIIAAVGGLVLNIAMRKAMAYLESRFVGDSDTEDSAPEE